MRHLPVLLAALSLAGALPGLALAQTPPPAVASTNGVSVAETRTWLAALGGAVGEPAVREGLTTLNVADQPLPWNLTFYACGPSLCDDVQYSAVFSGPITLDQINAWNRGNRFLKAFFVPAAADAEASAVVQYDVVLTSTGAGAAARADGDLAADAADVRRGAGGRGAGGGQLSSAHPGESRDERN